MSEIDAINQRLNGTDERLNKGEARFTEIADALSKITVHLQSQDATLAQMAGKLDTVVTGTDSIVTMWSGGVRAARFFCRLAEAWTFLLKKVFFPIGTFGIVLLILVAAFYYHEYGRFPVWITDAFKLLIAIL
jgi:hypothetical protein